MLATARALLMCASVGAAADAATAQSGAADATGAAADAAPADDALAREHSAFWSATGPAQRAGRIDENEVVLVGGSNGCIGACCYAMRAPTAYAAFAGTVGCPVRLTNPTLRVDGQLHLSNLSGQRFWLANGARDELFPVQDIRDYWELFSAHGAEVDHREHAQAGHGLRLDADDERAFATFSFGARRDPLPDTLSWATGRTDRCARRAWLELLELGAAPSDAPELSADAVMPRICTGKYRRLKPPPARLDLDVP
jgi:predicted esterase